jgi:6-pyruvoyltetrahydropterin/6-carboxytetrahydropterin synthase
MYRVTIIKSFAAAHFLRNYRGSCENLHGHNWKVEVFCKGAELDGAGLLIDYRELKQATMAIVERLDHKLINDIPPFNEAWNPSSEYIARFFLEELKKTMAAKSSLLEKIRIWETDTSYAEYWA